MAIWQLTRGFDITCTLSYASNCLYIHSCTLYSKRTSHRGGTLPHHYTYGRYVWPQIGGAIMITCGLRLEEQSRSRVLFFLECPPANSMSHTLLFIVLEIRYVLSMGFVWVSYEYPCHMNIITIGNEYCYTELIISS